MEIIRRTSLLGLISVAAAICIATPAIAADGIIVLYREVQPRVATHPTDMPDPNPTVVNTNISRDVNNLLNGSASGNRVSAELSDSDFAGVTSGSSIKSTIMPGGNLTGLSTFGTTPTSTQNTGGNDVGHAGGAGAGLSNTINGTIQRGLAPLNMLGGGQ